MAKVLVVDDEKGIREALEAILARQGYEVTLVKDLASASRQLESEDFDAALIDLRLPDGDGRELISKARKKFTSVIMISGHATVSLAVEAVKQGAFDFLEKPLDRDRLLIILGNAIREKELRQKDEPSLIYSSKKMEKIVREAEKFARSKEPVLIVGETGSGKEVLAKLIHRMSLHSKGPFVAVNCAAIPESLAESELFGHSKGAFTGAMETRKGKFQSADGGTLFLDEIGDLPLALQAKLLRAIEEEIVEPVGADKGVKVNTRILAATNSDISKWTKEGKFRQDLFYRISGLRIEIPPLRERKEDIGLLAEKFLKDAFEREGWKYREPPADFLGALEGYDWKGNVRELRRVMSRVVLLCGDGEISVKALPDEFSGKIGKSGLKNIKEDAEAGKIIDTLKEFSGNVQKTAKDLKISRSRLYEKLSRYKINPGDFRS
jgi:two-component system, NtrC family, nitrogen regulation response regulator NtrX